MASSHVLARGDERVLSIIIPLLLSLGFVLVGLNHVHRASDPNWEDTAPYLQIALFINQHGGVANFPLLCLTGEYTANNQHPFYPLLLSPFATRDLGFFEHAKLVSLGMGWLAVLACFFVGRHLFGLATGSVAATFLALSEAFVQYAAHVACETTLVLFIVLFLYGTIRVLEPPHVAKWAAFAGACAGAAFMTKGTGLLLLPVYAAAHVLRFGLRGAFNKSLGLFVLLFLLVASPLLARNGLVYGNPVYAGINAHFLWLDDGQDAYDPRYGLIRRLPEMSMQMTDAPTWRSYLASHSWPEILSRLVSGAIGEGRLIQQSLATVLPIAQGVLSFVILVLCALGLLWERQSSRRLVVLVFLCAMVVPFVWYFQVVPAIRFVLPLIPVLCLYAANGFVKACQWLEKRWFQPVESSSIGHWISTASAAGLVLVIAAALGTANLASSNRGIAFTEDYEDVSRWVGAHVRSDDLLLMSASNPYWKYGWYVGLKGTVSVWMPDSDLFKRADLSVLDRLLWKTRAGGSRYVIVHKDDVSMLPFLSNYFETVLPDGLVEKHAIEGWRLIHTDPEKPAKFLIYRVEHQNGPSSS